jgi:hypothetical protein
MAPFVDDVTFKHVQHQMCGRRREGKKISGERRRR